MIYSIAWVLFTAIIFLVARAYNKKASGNLKVKFEPYALSAGFGLVLLAIVGILK